LLIGVKDLGTRGSNAQVAKPTKPPKTYSTTLGRKMCSNEVSNKKRVTTRSKG
jgi:hypothetical protein